MYPEDIKTKFSLLQLLPPNLHDKGLADHIRDDANVQMQEAMDEHVTKLAAKKTHVIHHTLSSCSTPSWMPCPPMKPPHGRPLSSLTTSTSPSYKN
mmetsp:Transcript_23412/g.57587  ORF Transcript_23412/g.57587 Transcript_23412/m.57587 type:complete len:96 (+) Transcript_23412:531-818(+)